jgi:hypothetical protein
VALRLAALTRLGFMIGSDVTVTMTVELPVEPSAEPKTSGELGTGPPGSACSRHPGPDNLRVIAKKNLGGKKAKIVLKSTLGQTHSESVIWPIWDKRTGEAHVEVEIRRDLGQSPI